MIDKNGWEPEQLESMRLALIVDCRNKAGQAIEDVIGNGFSFEYDGKQYVFDTYADSLSKLAIAYGVASRYKAMDMPYQQAMVMKDFQVVVMDRDAILENYDAMIAYGLNAYNEYATLIAQLSEMGYYQLREWFDNN